MHFAAAHSTAVGIHILRDPALRLLIAGLLALCCSLLVPSLARASEYSVYECYPSINENYPDLKGGGQDNDRIRVGVDCTDSQPWHGILLYGYNASFSPISAAFHYDAPAGTYFRTVSFHSFMGRADYWDPQYWAGQAVFSTGGGSVFSESLQSYYGSDKAQWVVRENVNSIYWDTSCGNSYSYCVHDANIPYGNFDAIGDNYFVVHDYTNPKLQLGGSAFAHQVVAGQVGLDIAASDVGSGVRSAWVDVNGSRYANPQTSCPGIPAGAGYATQFRPCGDLSTSVTLNTAAAPFREGQNTVRVCATDYSTVGGVSPNTVCEERTITVDNSCTDSQGAQQGQASLLSAAFETPAGPAGRTLTVHSTEGAKLTGQLRNGGGGAVGGASICLYEQIDAPAEIRQLAQVTKTRSDGGYALHLPAGPSRNYEVVYRSNDQTLDERGLDLRSIVVPTLGVGPDIPGAQSSAKRGKRPIRNGQAARFSGQIPGPYAANRVVALEALIGRGCAKRKHRGRSAIAAKRRKRCQPNKWRTFKTTRTDSRGRFSDTYRFTQTTGTARYSFRATVPSQAGYPYLEGSSDVQQVTVRGRRLRR